MKSRINWLVQGERNTTFYHVSTLVRRKRNRIYAIQNNVGDWVSEERDVMNFFRKGFEDLFSTTKSLSHNTVTPPSRWQVSLSDSDRECLTASVSEDEIRVALWSMKAFKAPGPDGLHAGFFQQFWPLVGPKVVQEIKKIFPLRKIPEYLNRTLIALIPKIQGLQ